MRKVLVILALTIATVVASAGDAFAQRRGRGYRNSWVYDGDGGGRYYNGGYYGRGSGYYGAGYNSVPYTYEPSYYETSPIVQGPATEVRQSFYNEPSASQSQRIATMVVLLPRADAKVWFDGSATSQQGMERSFYSPPLDPGSTYTYTIRARWMENGQPIERERRVNAQPGRSVTVSFRGDSAENLQTPPRPK